MTFARVLLAWAAVTLLFGLWREAERRMRAIREPIGPALRRSLPATTVEAALLTLFAGLWFTSLGSGGAVTLFLIVGALMEVPSRLRSQPIGELPWKPVVGGVIRIVLAGLLLGAVMG
jgi:hypothetical protein